MKLKRLRLEHFRRFRGAVELAGFSAGLNVLAGPNESGKSTLVHAVRVAFFERYRTSTLQDLQPWDDSGAAPSVTLEFDHGGQEWRLTKRFVKQARCDLWIAGERLSGDEAEARLAEVFGYEYAGRGGSAQKHWGVPGLMWIEQGQGQALREPVQHAAGHLRTALGQVIDDVAGREGDAVIDAVQRLLEALQTGTGRPRGEYAEALEALAAHRTRRDALQARARAYAGCVDRLAQLRQRLSAEAREAPWRALEQQARDAQQRLDDARALERAQETDEQRLIQFEAACREADATLNRLTEWREAHAASAARLDDAAETLRQAQARLAAAVTAQVQARQACDTAQRQVQAARARAEREAAVARVSEFERQRDDVARALEQARAIEAERGALLRDHLSDPLPDDADARLDRLRQATRAALEWRLRREAAATRLAFDLNEGQSVTLATPASDPEPPAGDTLTGTGERLLDATTTLTIAGVGSLRIEPGGVGVTALKREFERAEVERIAAAQALGVNDLPEAEARLAAVRERSRKLEMLAQRLSAYAPEGLVALESRMAALDAALTQARELAAAMAPDDGAPMAVSVGTGASTADLERALTTATTRLTAAEGALQAAREEQVAAQARYDGANEEHERLAGRLANPALLADEAAARERRSVAEQAKLELEVAMAERQARIDAAHPEALALDVERLTASAREAEAGHRHLELECARLEAELRAQDAEGLDETLAQEEAAIAGLEARIAQFDRRARALVRLRDGLVAARQRLHDRLHAPLRERLQHYLQRVFPGASVGLDEALCPAKVSRDGDTVEDVEALSFGAREQIGLLGRLAYADLLQDAGHPTLLILDDALVHSDPERMARMKAPLFDAAQRHQILVFTCHPDAWRDAGVPVRDLETALVPQTPGA